MHLGVPGVSIDLPAGRNIDNFARILNQYLQNVHTSTKFYIRMVVSGKFEEDELTYNKFTVLKQICGHSQQLALIIELG